MSTRRRLLSLGLAAILAAGGAAAAAPAPAKLPPQPGDMSLGNPKARVHVVEYASASCPHCAHFDEDVFPALKKKVGVPVTLSWVTARFTRSLRAFIAFSSLRQALNCGSVRPALSAMRSRTPRKSPVWNISSWFLKIASRTVKYLSLPAQRATRKPAAATSSGGVRNSRRV